VAGHITRPDDSSVENTHRRHDPEEKIRSRQVDSHARSDFSASSVTGTWRGPASRIRVRLVVVTRRDLSRKESELMVELIHEHVVHVRTPNGDAYVPRTYGERQTDGTWEGWLEFDPISGNGPALRTERETSQATREALEVWSSGLESVYFEGAFTRARVISPSSPRARRSRRAG
jgi:hypothetical protein